MIIKRILNTGAVIRQKFPVYKVRLDKDRQVIEHDFITNLFFHLKLWKGDVIAGTAAAALPFQSTARHVFPAVVASDPMMAVVYGIAMYTVVAFVTDKGIEYVQPPLPTVIPYNPENPTGMREYETLNPITGTPSSLTEIVAFANRTAGDTYEWVKNRAEEGSRFLTKTLETAVLIGVLGVLYKVFTITE